MPDGTNFQSDESHKHSSHTNILVKFSHAWDKEGGAVGIGKKVLSGRAGRGVVRKVLYGAPRDSDPAPPKSTFRRSEFVHDTITDKDSSLDDRAIPFLHKRRKDYGERQALEVKVDEVYPLMRKFWTIHIGKLRTLFHDHPDLLNDKSSYLYAQYLIARTITVDARPRGLGQVDIAKLNAYFQTAEGYNESMRYMEEELMRLEQANNVISLLKNGYKPDGEDLIQAGVVSARDWAQAVGVYGAGVMSSFAAAVAVGKILGSLNVIAPVIGSALPAVAPWVPAVMVAGVGAKLTYDKIEHVLSLTRRQDIMADCNALFSAMQQGPEYQAERTYLRSVYGIDPGDLRFKQSKGPGYQHAVFASEGITTSNWEGSKKMVYDIKETRRIFYEQVCGIKESDMYGVPEEAFFDINGKFRKQILPEGRGVIYAQEVWDRYKELGGYVVHDAQTGQVRTLTPIEAIQRFQRARREVVFTRVQDRAESIISQDRQTELQRQERLITANKTAIGKDGKVREQEKKTLTEERSQLQALNDGEGGKDGLKRYAEGWLKGAGSPHERLKEVAKVRHDIYEKVSPVVAWIQPESDIGIGAIDGAITALKERKTKTDEGLNTRLKVAQDELVKIDPKKKLSLTDDKGKTKEVLEDNPIFTLKKAEIDKVQADIDKINSQIEELESLKQKLLSTLARYNVQGEHGAGYAENLKKMQSAYMRLVTAAAKRGGTGQDMSEVQVSEALRAYPGGAFSPPVPKGTTAPIRHGTVADLMKTLANEAVPPLWEESLNDSFDNKMTILYAVSYAKAQERIKVLDTASGVGGKKYTQGGKNVHEIFSTGVSDGKFNEMTLLARNVPEIGTMGAVSGVDMGKGDNIALTTYARQRLDIYADTLQELVDQHTRDIATCDKKAEEIDKKYESAEAQYAVIEGLIEQEKGTDQTKKISAQVRAQGLTGDASVRRMTDTRDMTVRSEEERSRFQDYEKTFLLAQKAFPPAMLEILDVIFHFRSDAQGAEKLNNIYAVLESVGKTGATTMSPQEVLADMIYYSHPSIREMIVLTRDQGVLGYGYIDTFGKQQVLTWDQIVLSAFNYRQNGFLQYGGQHPVFVASVRHPFSTMEMNTILTSIHDQIIDKVAKSGITVR